MKSENNNLRLVGYFVLLFCTLTTVSCTSKKHLSIIVSDFADIECRAIRLREFRFDLANKVRFAEDTLMHTHLLADSQRLRYRLKDLRPQQDSVAVVSRLLADSIRLKFDNLTKEELKTKDKQVEFNKQLNDTLKARDCVGN